MLLAKQSSSICFSLLILMGSKLPFGYLKHPSSLFVSKELWESWLSVVDLFIFRFKLFLWKRSSRESQAPFEPKTSSRSSLDILEASWMTATADSKEHSRQKTGSRAMTWVQTHFGHSLFTASLKFIFIWIELIRRDKKKKKRRHIWTVEFSTVCLRQTCLFL